MVLGSIDEGYSNGANPGNFPMLIDGDGGFNDAGIEQFIKEVKLAECGLSYAIVSIMGPQSSAFAIYSVFTLLSMIVTGKSTLLNNLFGTNFREMDAFRGRCCHNIGWEQASRMPLLKTVFQVTMRLFSPCKTTLMFVIRDKTRTPLENLEPVLREDIQKIWDSVPTPEAHRETPLSEFFNVEVVALSSFEEKEEQFREQVANLRQRFYYSIAPGGLAGDQRDVVPASGFSFSAEQIWKVIKENRDLDLPAHKVMVATVRCEEIANEKYAAFTTNEDWCQLEETVKSCPVTGFGKKLNSILNIILSEYDAEATYFDESVRSSKRKQLEEKLLQLLQPAYQSIVGHIRSGTFDKFKEAFDKALNGEEAFSVAAHGCTETYITLFDEGSADAIIELANWDSSKARDKLHHDIDAHVASVLAAKFSELHHMRQN
ncbi:hypothetical protein SLE2022_384880 [Rubroshorea leprosula]